jgi:alkylation response protein AidB-like acyl-CoA dehydrogenase
MDLTETPAETAFRSELRDWLAANPPGRCEGDDDAQFAWRLAWQRRLYDGGWCGVHWPREHGGRSASLTESAIFFEEIAGADAPLPVNIIGILLVGPTLMRWGTEEQKDRHLSAILSGEEVWCQGFSEPGAGSDFGALECRATQRGDDFVISGQKVWTSFAQHSRWCLLVARTDSAHKHKGLTCFLLDMRTPGVEVRPLRQITGDAEFNELFLDEAVVPATQVLGGVGNGWSVALTTLMNERSGLAFFQEVALRQQFHRLLAELAERGRLDDARVRDELADVYARLQVLRLTAYRGLAVTERLGQPGPEGSLAKLMWSDTAKRLTQLAVDLLGHEALRADARWAYEFLRSQANSIEGGTTEILKSIVAERVLGLPRSR